MRCLTLQNTREASLRVVPTNPVAFDDVQSVFSDRGPAARWASGEGSMTRRADGRWMGRFYAWTTAGTRRRITVYGRTRPGGYRADARSPGTRSAGRPRPRPGLEASRLARLLAGACGFPEPPPGDIHTLRDGGSDGFETSAGEISAHKIVGGQGAAFLNGQLLLASRSAGSRL